MGLLEAHASLIEWFFGDGSIQVRAGGGVSCNRSLRWIALVAGLLCLGLTCRDGGV